MTESFDSNGRVGLYSVTLGAVDALAACLGTGCFLIGRIVLSPGVDVRSLAAELYIQCRGGDKEPIGALESIIRERRANKLRNGINELILIGKVAAVLKECILERSAAEILRGDRDSELDGVTALDHGSLYICSGCLTGSCVGALKVAEIGPTAASFAVPCIVTECVPGRIDGCVGVSKRVDNVRNGIVYPRSVSADAAVNGPALFLEEGGACDVDRIVIVNLGIYVKRIIIPKEVYIRVGECGSSVIAVGKECCRLLILKESCFNKLIYAVCPVAPAKAELAVLTEIGSLEACGIKICIIKYAVEYGGVLLCNKSLSLSASGTEAVDIIMSERGDSYGRIGLILAAERAVDALLSLCSAGSSLINGIIGIPLMLACRRNSLFAGKGHGYKLILIKRLTDPCICTVIVKILAGE